MVRITGWLGRSLGAMVCVVGLASVGMEGAIAEVTDPPMPLSQSSAFVLAQAVKLTTESRVGTNGMGPVLTGMTVREAERASGLRLKKIASGGRDGTCHHMEFVGGLSDVMLMVNNGRVAVVFVRNPRVKTLRGAGIGDSEARIQALYPGRLQPGESVAARVKVLKFVPKDQADRNYRLVFEFSIAGQLTQFRAGKMPEVEWIEGCF